MMLMLAALLMMTEIPPEAERLGKRVAATGMLATLLPMIAAKEADEMVKDHPELSAAEQAELRRIADETRRTMAERLNNQMGSAYAKRLTLAELRAIVAFNESPAAARFRAAVPAALMETMQAAGPIDFKKETLAAFCARTGKACPKP